MPYYSPHCSGGKVAAIWLVPKAHTLAKSIDHWFRVLDSVHTGLVFASIWIYLIRNFGDTSKINDIPEYAVLS
jgi:hypothetical protein